MAEDSAKAQLINISRLIREEDELIAAGILDPLPEDEYRARAERQYLAARKEPRGGVPAIDRLVYVLEAVLLGGGLLLAVELALSHYGWL
jgi:hypothetical protein